MRRFWKWLAPGFALLAVVLVGIVLVLQQWVGSADFRTRLEREAAQALGVPVRLGPVAIDLWPAPAVAFNQVRIDSKPALTLDRVEIRPALAPLLQGRFGIATLVVRDAVLPQQAIAALAAPARKPARGASAPPSEPSAPDLSLLPRRAVLDNVSWVDAQGQRLTFDARSALDDAGWPESVELAVTGGRYQGLKARLHREADRWPVRIDVGGGHITGDFRLDDLAAGTRRLHGEFSTENVEVAALTAPSRTLTGKLQARTRINAQFQDPARLAEVLRTDTQFTVRQAVVHGIDLAAAVKTVGMSRGGSTPLETLAGHVSTQGKAIQLGNLVATSGALAATGQVAIAPNRSLSGRVQVDLSGSQGAIGVPLAVGGTLDDPSVSLSRSALVGAAVGTMLAPGVGTAGGAKLGDRLGDGLKGLFGR